MQILHVDDALVVAIKPAGWLAVPGRGADKADCLAARVQALHPDARVVHRLDQATSGLMLFARGPEHQRQVALAFEQRRVGKAYVALVHGLPADDEGCIELPLSADWPRRPRQKVDLDAGRPARTEWRVLQRDALQGVSRLELRPVTGRTHQLRVHLAAIGHPIAGDALYGPQPDATPRLMLHARWLRLAHPASGQTLEWVSEPRF